MPAARTAVPAAIALMVLAVVGCSSDAQPATPPSSVPPSSVPAAAGCASRQPELRVDRIDESIAAVEHQLGGAQRYFEINATDLLVNLFVAVDGGRRAQPFVFIEGELSSQDPVPAEGFTFSSAAIDLDPMTVTSCVADELETSTPSLFDVVAGADGSPHYNVVVESTAGGRLIVTVAGDGQILAVDPAT